MFPYDKMKEEKEESLELELRYGARQELKQEKEWISKPEGMSMEEWYSDYRKHSK